jgi:early secretory antigenic target protein ESAT-6
MTRYQIDSEAVAAATSSVQAAAGRIQADVSGLHAQLLDLQSSWTGQAASAFQAVVADWTICARQVEEALVRLNTGLAAAGQQYAEIEAQNARMFMR